MPRNFSTLAAEVRDLLSADPSLSVAEIAVQTDETDECITSILDEWRVVDGQPTHVGPGGGGGWVPEAA